VVCVNPHVGNDVAIWECVTGHYVDGDINDDGRVMLQQHTVHHDHFLRTQRSVQVYSLQMLDVSTLIHWFLDFPLPCSKQYWTFVWKEAELSTDCHLVVCNMHLRKPTGPTQTWKTTRFYCRATQMADHGLIPDLWMVTAGPHQPLKGVFYTQTCLSQNLVLLALLLKH